jgi:multidrug resistance protein MdtO
MASPDMANPNMGDLNIAGLNMAARGTQLRYQPARRTVSWPWFREFIRWEIAPYPGRLNTVVRMTITATLVMIIVMTFHIPNPFLAAFFSLLVARENLAATWSGARQVVLGFAAATLYTLLGMMLFRGYPISFFFWVVGSFYLIFFVMRTATNYAAAAAFGVPIAVALPVWDRSMASQAQVEGTLWPVLIVAIGTGITVATEAVYRIFNSGLDRSDPLIASLDDKLLAVEEVLKSAASLNFPPKSISNKILQYQMTGTSRLRTMLQRQGLNPSRRAQRTALIAIVGRLIGLGADVMHTAAQPAEDDAVRLRALSNRLGTIRTELRESGVVSASLPLLEGKPSSTFPMLQEMEQTVAIIPQVFQGNEIIDGAPRREWWHALFVPDAFHNPEYLRFALAGCLSASVCYFLYNALDWPGLNTSVLTCIVTALSTIGTSLQAQFLRLAGFVVGGLIFGISAQILILPGVDSIFGFALFFAAVTAVSAWFATSSPRLSYFGVQIALSYYFVHLSDSHIQTDLTIARDKVIGVLLGILAMGFIFDRFGTKSDALQLQKLLARNVRMLAELGRCPAHGALTADSQFIRLRSQINDSFAGLTTQMDALQFEFEFRNRRREDVAEWERIQRAQPALRSIYLLELTLLTHRGRREINSELTPQQNQALDLFLNEYSDELMHIAAWIAHEEDAPARITDDSIQLLRQAFDSHDSPNSQAITDICQKMASSLLMLRNECQLAF